MNKPYISKFDNFCVDIYSSLLMGIYIYIILDLQNYKSIKTTTLNEMKDMKKHYMLMVSITQA